MEATPFVAALVWGSVDVAHRLRELGSVRQSGPSLQVLCDAVKDNAPGRDFDPVLPLIAVSQQVALDGACPNDQVPLVCVTADLGKVEALIAMAKAGASLRPSIVCDDESRDPIALLRHRTKDDATISIKLEELRTQD